MKEYPYSFKKGLGKGLKPSKSLPRGSQWLSKSLGGVSEDGVLKGLESLGDPISVTGATFPYPQIFHLKLRTIVCTSGTIYEYLNESLTKVFYTTAIGTIWSVADFGEFVVFCNGKIMLNRDPISGKYLINSDLPVGLHVCNLNGQLLISGPGVTVTSGFYKDGM